jgi:hypothetical protein
MAKNNAVGGVVALVIVVALGYWAYTSGMFAKLFPAAKSNNATSTPADVKANNANRTLADALRLSPNASLPLLAPVYTLADAAQVKLADADPNRPLIVRATASADDGGNWSRSDGNFV